MKKKGLDEYKSKNEKENIGYIFLSFIISLFLSQKESNHLIDMGKRIKSVNYFVFISKSVHYIIA